MSDTSPEGRSGGGNGDETSAEMEPVFIDFEGIDGSGKTTLSNRLAAYLIECGIPVHHARDKGVFRSEISKAIRDLTRDPRFLRMSDVTEFLLYVARDTQMIDEYIRPKLQPGHLVFCDRYLYSAITHSHHARGLPREEVDSVLRLAARGLWPDLVVYCDVDPLTSRVRKKNQKVREKRLGDFGRKGLMGIGFREEMRKGFLRLADEDSDTWLVIDNANSTIEQSLQRIFFRVRDVLRSKGYPEIPDPEWAKIDASATVPIGGATTPLGELGEATLDICKSPDTEERKAAITELFYRELDRLTSSQPAFTALFIGGLETPEAHELREKVVDSEPSMVANGLRGLRSDAAMGLRERLKELEPIHVARSLSGMSLDPRACALREALVDVVPDQVALAVKGQDTEHAWALRDHIGKKAAREVLASVRGLETEKAWALREKRAKEKYFPALLESLSGLDDDRAWEWREQLSDEYLPWVLISLRGLSSERAWNLRLEHIGRAPKIIIKTIGRSSDPYAWQLREAAKRFAKEVLDSLSGLDSGDAWRLRVELKEKWPNTAVSSLGAGNQSERAWKFRWDMLAANPDNLLLMKHLVKASLRAADNGDFDEDDDDFT
jgi:dTMP kinase